MINSKQTKRDFLIFLSKQNIKKILDLGCGKGFMSKFFNKNEVEVLGIDIKETSQSYENFKFLRGDIRKESFGGENDLVIASNILHFFKYEESLDLIKKMQRATSNQGYNFLICLSDQDEFAKMNPEKFYPNIRVLSEVYNDWSLIKGIDDKTELEEHDELPPHHHHILFLIFQKKGKSNEND